MQGMGMRQMGPHVAGTITAISSNMITVSTEARGQTAATTYTVDATNATVTKDGAASTLASLAVGDKIFADGTLSGTTLTATKIMNGFGGKGMMGMGPGGQHGRGAGVMGTVSAVSGNTVTVTNSNGTTYTIDATNAKVTKMVDLNVSDIKVGDTIGAQGTVSGTSVTASHIMDGVPQAPQSQ